MKKKDVRLQKKKRERTRAALGGVRLRSASDAREPRHLLFLILRPSHSPRRGSHGFFPRGGSFFLACGLSFGSVFVATVAVVAVVGVALFSWGARGLLGSSLAWRAACFFSSLRLFFSA